MLGKGGADGWPYAMSAMGSGRRSYSSAVGCECVQAREGGSFRRARASGGLPSPALWPPLCGATGKGCKTQAPKGSTGVGKEFGRISIPNDVRRLCSLISLAAEEPKCNTLQLCQGPIFRRIPHPANRPAIVVAPVSCLHKSLSWPPLRPPSADRKLRLFKQP